MGEQVASFRRVLALIEKAGCHNYLILIGSWTEFVYREASVLNGFEPRIRTLDVDFLVRNLRRPIPPANLAAVARQAGFLVESDRLYGTTRFFDPSGLEVEFLIGKVGAGLEPALPTNVGVTAQALRHLDILLHNTIQVHCLGYSVLVPMPEAYVLHKMVINGDRKNKIEKDAQAICGIWPYLDSSTFDRLLEAATKKERAAVVRFKAGHGLT